MKSTSFRILSDNSFSLGQGGIDFEFCVFGVELSNITNTLSSLKSLLGDIGTYKISILDVFHYYDDELKLRGVLKDYPNITIFSPSHMDFVESINSFTKYSHSKYIVFLPSGSILRKFDMRGIVGVFNTEEYCMGIVPKSTRGGDVIESVFMVDDFDKMDIYQTEFKNEKKTLIAYEGIWIMHRERNSLLKEMDSRYTQFLYTSLDRGFHAFKSGYYMKCLEVMELDITLINDLESRYLKLDEFDKLCFMVKNVSRFSLLKSLKKKDIIYLMKVIKKSVHLLRFYFSKRKNTVDIDLYSDEDIASFLSK